MKRLFSTVILSLLFLVLTVGCQQQGAVQQRIESVSQPTVVDQQPSCAEPTLDMIANCQRLEAEILAATVRLELAVFDEAGQMSHKHIGHAAVKNGRYLLTHNHYGISLSNPPTNQKVQLSIFKATGEIILKDAPITALAVAAEDSEALLLDFGDYGSTGLFGAMGVASANFKHSDDIPLTQGMVVAQIDWDGTAAHVDWVTIKRVVLNEGTPRLELANFVLPGASGSPVFWNSHHIANNWSRVTESNADTGQTIHQFSVAALNSQQIVTANGA